MTELDIGESGPPLNWTYRQRRLVLLQLALATAIGSTGLAAGGTAGALLAADFTGSNAAAGLPTGLLVVGSAVGALLIAVANARGRRGPGLVYGYAIGALGAAVVIVAAVERSMLMLLIGSFALGTANSAVFFTRYAAAATAEMRSRRGQALGVVFFATAVGAVISSALLGPSGAVAHALGLPRLAGLYLVAVIAFGCSASLLALTSSRRAPRLGRGSIVLNQGRTERGPDRAAVLKAVRNSKVKTALYGLVVTNFGMVAMMTIAPIHLISHGEHLGMVGAIVALHVAAMFGPSPLSGYLADRFGASVVLRSGLVLIGAAGVVGMLSHDPSTPVMIGHLMLLGVGWNMGVVGASTLLGAAVPDLFHPHVEGIGEVLMGLAAAVAAPIAGLLADAGGYRALSIGLAAVAAVGLFIALQTRHVLELRSS